MQSDPVASVMLGQHLLRDIGHLGMPLERLDMLGTGAQRQQGQQTGAGADVDHPITDPHAGQDGLLEREVACSVVQHGKVPPRDLSHVRISFPAIEVLMCLKTLV